MRRRFIFITGTDTGVGKTVLTVLLTRWLVQRGGAATALKPVCSGSRDDASALRAALGGKVALDVVNPWHFKAPLAPLLAARKERATVLFRDVVNHIRSTTRSSEIVLVEGAGGLLSPLGEDFDSRDLISALGANAIIVAPNRLGVVNHVLLTLEALPRAIARTTQIVLMASANPDRAAATNRQLLSESVEPGNIHQLPRLKDPPERSRIPKAVARLAAALLQIEST